MRILFVLLLAALSVPGKAHAWGKKGHEVVAYIAYGNLDDPTRKQVDYLVTLNPCYPQWQNEVAALPAAQQGAALFMLAATWPDLIKSIPHQPPYACQPDHVFIEDGAPGTNGRVNPDVPPATLEASQNIGYDDPRRHQYWHFVDLPFSPDNTPIQPAATPNALTQLLLLSAALKSDEGNQLKSFDMVWVEHLVGDLNQPLHDTTRFTAGHPDGDRGGNAVLICSTPNCTRNLHSYWDDLPGPGNDLAAAIAMGSTLNGQPPPGDDLLNVEDPGSWVTDGLQLAQKVVYAAPVSTDGAGDSPAGLNAAYETSAKQLVNTQLFLAGQRLAALLRDYLN